MPSRHAVERLQIAQALRGVVRGIAVPELKITKARLQCLGAGPAMRLSGGLCLRREARGGRDQRSQSAEPLRMDDLILDVFFHGI